MEDGESLPDWLIRSVREDLHLAEVQAAELDIPLATSRSAVESLAAVALWTMSTTFVTAIGVPEDTEAATILVTNLPHPADRTVHLWDDPIALFPAVGHVLAADEAVAQAERRRIDSMFAPAHALLRSQRRLAVHHSRVQAWERAVIDLALRLSPIQALAAAAAVLLAAWSAFDPDAHPVATTLKRSVTAEDGFFAVDSTAHHAPVLSRRLLACSLRADLGEIVTSRINWSLVSFVSAREPSALLALAAELLPEAEDIDPDLTSQLAYAIRDLSRNEPDGYDVAARLNAGVYNEEALAAALHALGTGLATDDVSLLGALGDFPVYG
jgi:hypothetical protein